MSSDLQNWLTSNCAQMPRNPSMCSNDTFETCHLNMCQEIIHGSLCQVQYSWNSQFTHCFKVCSIGVFLLKTSTIAYQSKITSKRSKHLQKSKLSLDVFVRETNSSFQLVMLVKCHCAAIWAVKKFSLFYNLKGEIDEVEKLYRRKMRTVDDVFVEYIEQISSNFSDLKFREHVTFLFILGFSKP